MEPPLSAPPPNMSPPLTTVSYPPILSPNSTTSEHVFSYAATGDGGGGGGEVARKKRGRPRKYAPEGNGSGGMGRGTELGAVSAGAIVVVDGGGAEEGRGSDQAKRGRGRPPGSGKKQLDALGAPAGISFTPHVILVKAGEDICSKIMAFSQQGPRTICLLSANGTISNASICHSTLSGGTVTYEGRYEIISLRGSFTPSESNAGRSREGGLSVTLAGPDGEVLGGSLSGMLIAASPVQIIVGSFIEDGKKAKFVPSSLPNMLNFSAPVSTASPQSQEPSNESSDENGGGGPYDENSGPYSNANQQPPPLHSMPMYSQSGWASGP